MEKITPIPFSSGAAKTIIARLAADSSNIVWIDDCSGGGEWEDLANWRQAENCLQSGEVVGSPRFDKKTSCWICRMHRFSAGQDILVEVIISPDNAELYVINICDR